MNARRRRSHRWGIVAEYLCILRLVLQGYSIIARRHRNAMGEIDIIAVRGNVVAFIEVKARAELEAALASVTQSKRRRLRQAATAFLAGRAQYAHHGLRFDVMVVTSPWNISHRKDAWRED